MQPPQQLTPPEYALLRDLVYSQRNPLFWQDIKEKLVALSEGVELAPSNTLTTGQRETFGGGSKASNIISIPEAKPL